MDNESPELVNVDDVDEEEPKRKPRRNLGGSRAGDPEIEKAVEAMMLKGAMQSDRSRGGSWRCKSDLCPGKCQIRRNTRGVVVTKWVKEHVQGCDQVGKQPARMQFSVRQVVRELAVEKTRKQIQGDDRVKSLTGRAFNGARIEKMIGRDRAQLSSDKHLGSIDGLKRYVGSMTHKAVEDNDIMVGYKSWEPDTIPPVDPAVQTHPEDWDANAPTPAPVPGDHDFVEQTTADSAVVATVAVSEVLGTADFVEAEIAGDNDESDDGDDDEADPDVKLEQEDPKKKAIKPYSVSVLVCKSAFLKMMQCSEAWRHIDGTFDVAPKDACLQNIGYTMNRVYYPVAYVLASSPGKKSYESSAHVLAIFEIIESMARELAGEAGVTAWKFYGGKWMRDGGKGYAKAIRLYFPNAQQRMCWFHLMQAIRKRKAEFPKVYDTVLETLRKLHLCADPTEFALGMGIFLKHLSKSRDGRTFVRYWNNTQFRLGRADGNWSISGAGDVTTNNALESFNGRMTEMVFGEGRQRRSVMFCLNRYVLVMSNVLHDQQTEIEGTESTMWTEYRDVEDKKAFKKATKHGLDMRPVMVQTYSIGTSYKVLPNGIGMDQADYARLAGERANSLAQWLAWMNVRHVTESSCTCWIFCDSKICKHVCAIRVLNDTQITPARPNALAHDSNARAPEKKGREGGQCPLGGRLKELDGNIDHKRTKKNPN